MQSVAIFWPKHGIGCMAFLVLRCAPMAPVAAGAAPKGQPLHQKDFLLVVRADATSVPRQRQGSPAFEPFWFSDVAGLDDMGTPEQL